MDMRVASAYSAFSVYNTNNAAGAKKTDRAGKADDNKDVFTLSVQAEDYQAVRKALSGVPDVRSDRVNAVKAKIEANAYNISAAEVAAKMIGNIGE